MPGFDAGLTRLQQLVKSLEAGDLSLEDSLRVFEEGVQLARACQAHLTSAEQRVEQLVRGGDEKSPPELAPFAADKQ
ncbi:MAG: exodeoxyribonuclease VII small subunit [Bdellovibrionales bacterium]|nr:exodeoxyribonuclease VII small subunit [Bdellovibrionales bacterium]